jgi:hypothetical protein
VFVGGIVWNTEIRCVCVVRSCLILRQTVRLLTVTYRCAVQVSEEETIGFWNYAILHLIVIELGVLP